MYRRKYSTKFMEAGQPFVKVLAQPSPFMTMALLTGIAGIFAHLPPDGL